MSPFVVGPAAVPVVRDPDAAKRDPELAVLSAMAHGKAEAGAEVALAALAASVGLDDERALLYSDVIMASLRAFHAVERSRLNPGVLEGQSPSNSLSEATRTLMEQLMASGDYQYQSDFAKTHQAKGRAEGEARAVLNVLDARGTRASTGRRELKC